MFKILEVVNIPSCYRDAVFRRTLDKQAAFSNRCCVWMRDIYGLKAEEVGTESRPPFRTTVDPGTAVVC